MGCMLELLTYLVVTAGIVSLFTRDPAAIVAAPIAPIAGVLAAVLIEGWLESIERSRLP